MADIALVEAGRLRIVQGVDHIQTPTLEEAEVMAVGQAARGDGTTGKFTRANATTTAEATVLGIVITRDVKNLTVIRYGLVDGFDLDALAYFAPVYLSNTDGAIADAAGTVSTMIGRVWPGWAVPIATAADKLLLVNCLARA